MRISLSAATTKCVSHGGGSGAEADVALGTEVGAVQFQGRESFSAQRAVNILRPGRRQSQRKNATIGSIYKKGFDLHGHILYDEKVTTLLTYL